MKPGDKLTCKSEYWLISNPNFLDKIFYTNLRFRKGSRYEIANIIWNCGIIIIKSSKRRTTIFYTGELANSLSHRKLEDFFEISIAEERRQKLKNIMYK